MINVPGIHKLLFAIHSGRHISKQTRVVWITREVVFSIAQVPHYGVRRGARVFYFCYLPYVKKVSCISAQTLSCPWAWRWRLDVVEERWTAALCNWAIFPLSHQIYTGINHQPFSWTVWDVLGQQRMLHPWAHSMEEKQKAAQSRRMALDASARDAERSSSLVSRY